MSKEIIIPKKQIELGFQSLLDRYENPTSTSTNNADVAATKTKGDAIFDSSMRQHEAASRLSDTVSLLKYIGQTLSDPKSSKLKCKEAIKITMKTVVPMISIVANEMSAAANTVNPPNPKNPPHYTTMDFLEIVEAIQINSAKRRLMIEKKYHK